MICDSWLLYSVVKVRCNSLLLARLRWPGTGPGHRLALVTTKLGGLSSLKPACTGRESCGEEGNLLGNFCDFGVSACGPMGTSAPTGRKVRCLADIRDIAGEQCSPLHGCCVSGILR